MSLATSPLSALFDPVKPSLSFSPIIVPRFERQKLNTMQFQPKPKLYSIKAITFLWALHVGAIIDARPLRSSMPEIQTSLIDLMILFKHHPLLISYPLLINFIYLSEMQVKAFKLPPLPNKKINQAPTQSRPNKLIQPTHRVPSYSRQKKEPTQENEENVPRLSRNKRPSSVRPYSRESVNSRDSRNSRQSSRQKEGSVARDKINHNAKIRISMPSVSALSWAIYEMRQAKLIYGKRMFKKREIASLTKIMNLITILELVSEFQLDAWRIKVKVSCDASCMIGTTANIKHNMEFNLYDLYFGMMLPSGNDAAFQIAQIGGALILMERNQKKLNKQLIYNLERFTEYYQSQNNPVKVFITQMNKLSKKIGMQNSNFSNPHGLSNPQNYSCAEDLGKLCTYCMDNQMFRYVVKTRFYYSKYRYHHSRLNSQSTELEISSVEFMSSSRKCEEITEGVLEWQNTNKMLNEEWSGIKTGITPNAGPCLAASVQKFTNGRSLEFLVILICSKSMEARWDEARQIVDWAISEKLFF